MTTAKSAQDQLTPEQHLANVRGIFEGTRTVMLLSHGPSGRIEGRPMALVRSDTDETLYLTTSIDSKKIAEIEKQPNVSVTANHDGYAIIEGIARVSQDRKLIDKLWKESWKAWYPDGKSDPSIAIIIVEPTEATYWDMSMTTGLSYLYRAIKARLTGSELEIKPGDVGHVDLSNGHANGNGAPKSQGQPTASRRDH